MARRVDGTDAASLWESLRWLAGICRSALAATPGQGLASVLFSVMSQVALLAALLLPWKLLVVVSANAFPTTLPRFLSAYETRELVLILSLATLAAFLLHIACEAGIGYAARRGAEAVLEKNGKTGLFTGHREQAARLYQRLLRTLGAGACCLLIASWLALAYPLLLLALLLYLAFGLAAVRYCSALPLWRKHRPPQDLVSKAWWGGGFLYLVAWVVADYWRGTLPGLATAFIALVLARQALVMSAQILHSLLALNRDRSRMEAIFLAHAPWVPKPQRDGGFQALLEPAASQTWVRDLLSGYEGSRPGPLDIACRPAEGGKIIYLTAAMAQGERAYLLKLYHRSSETVAQHEAEALRAATPSWPAPVLLGEHRVEEHICLAFPWHRKMRWMWAAERASWLQVLRGRLLECALPPELVQRYDRSHPSLSQRLQDVDWSFLKAFSTSGETGALCDALQGRWPDILEALDAMPRQLVLASLDRRMMATDAAGTAPVIYNWTRWRWEPVGAAWPFKRHSVGELGDILKKAAAAREDLRGVSTESAMRAALLFEFERRLQSRDFLGALDLVPTIHGRCMEGVG